jgi:hypothetical protein
MNVDLAEIVCQDADWILLFLDTVQWRSVVKTVKKFQVKRKVGNFLNMLPTVRLYSAPRSYHNDTNMTSLRISVVEATLGQFHLMS